MQATRPVLTAAHSVHPIYRYSPHVHVDWTLDQWRTVLFTNESSFSLEGKDSRVVVWRHRGHRYRDYGIAEHDRSLMVWGGISMGGRTDLYHVI